MTTGKGLSKTTDYLFRAKLWKYRGKGGWCFLTLPKALSQKIRKTHAPAEREWGRLPTTATIGKSSWTTAIWFDTKFGAYLLPVKGTIRNKEKLSIGQRVSVSLAMEKIVFPSFLRQETLDDTE